MVVGVVLVVVVVVVDVVVVVLVLVVVVLVLASLKGPVCSALYLSKPPGLGGRVGRVGVDLVDQPQSLKSEQSNKIVPSLCKQ